MKIRWMVPIFGLFFALLVLSESFVSPRIVFADSTALAVADIENPFAVLPYGDIDMSDRGWLVTEGILSSMEIDLNADGEAERLVVYVAPSVQEYDEPEFNPQPPVGGKDLRMAVFKQRDGEFEKCADIILEQALAVYYANIRISVWGDKTRHIYVRSATRRAEGITARYVVLSLHEDELAIDLALVGEQFPDGVGLSRVDVDEGTPLREIDYRDGTVIYRSEDYEDYLWGAADTAKNAENDESGNHSSADDASENLSCPFDNRFEPTNMDRDCAAALRAQLVTYGIEDENDRDGSLCEPVCAIYYSLDVSDGKDRFQIVDYTGLLRH